MYSRSACIGIHNVEFLCYVTHILERLLLFTRPLPRDGGMVEDHGAPEAGQLSKIWTRGRRETERRKE